MLHLQAGGCGEAAQVMDQSAAASMIGRKIAVFAQAGTTARKTAIAACNGAEVASGARCSMPCAAHIASIPSMTTGWRHPAQAAAPHARPC